MKVWVNVIGYQLVWFVVVWGVVMGYWWLVLLVFVLFVVWYLSWLDGCIDVWLMLVVVFIGIVLDFMFVVSDLVVYVLVVLLLYVVLVWIIVIWVVFLLILWYSFCFLYGWLLLVVVLGVVGVLLVYFGVV